MECLRTSEHNSIINTKIPSKLPNKLINFINLSVYFYFHNYCWKQNLGVGDERECVEAIDLPLPTLHAYIFIARLTMRLDEPFSLLLQLSVSLERMCELNPHTDT